MADGDFDEEEIWFSVEHRDQKTESGYKGKMSSEACTPRKSSTYGSCSSFRVIPKNTNYPQIRNPRKSAPVNIPDWSKIYNGGLRRDVDHGHHNDDDDEEDGEDGRIPPHELIAKKLARSQITSSSVYEGAGRTLKGRDLSKVRHAVLTITGFVE